MQQITVLSLYFQSKTQNEGVTMSREPWNGQPVKPGNWGTWAQIETPSEHKRRSCYTCVNCAEGACLIHNVVISEIGAAYWKQCEHFKQNQEKIKAIEHTFSNNGKELDGLKSTRNTPERTRATCARYDDIKQFCMFVMGTCIGANICKMYIERKPVQPEKKTKKKKKSK